MKCPMIIKEAFEAQHYDIEEGKLISRLGGNRPGTMTIAKNLGLKLNRPDPRIDYWTASMSVTKPDERKSAIKILKDRYKRGKKRSSFLSKTRKRYSDSLKELNKMGTMRCPTIIKEAALPAILKGMKLMGRALWKWRPKTIGQAVGKGLGVSMGYGAAKGTIKSPKILKMPGIKKI